MADKTSLSSICKEYVVSAKQEKTRFT